MAEAQTEPVALPPIVDLDALDSIRDDLLVHFEQGPVDIDAASVERVATNALLMFISAAEAARQANIPFTISNPSEPMLSAIERLGLTEQFALLTKGQN